MKTVRTWTKVEFFGGADSGASVLPPAEETVGLYLIPREKWLGRICDIGRVYYPDQSNSGRAPLWESASGLCGEIDGCALRDLWARYIVWFTPVPALPEGFAPAVGGV